MGLASRTSTPPRHWFWLFRPTGPRSSRASSVVLRAEGAKRIQCDSVAIGGRDMSDNVVRGRFASPVGGARSGATVTQERLAEADEIGEKLRKATRLEPDDKMRLAFNL